MEGSSCPIYMFYLPVFWHDSLHTIIPPWWTPPWWLHHSTLIMILSPWYHQLWGRPTWCYPPSHLYHIIHQDGFTPQYDHDASLIMPLSSHHLPWYLHDDVIHYSAFTATLSTNVVTYCNFIDHCTLIVMQSTKMPSSWCNPPCNFYHEDFTRM